MGGDTASSSNIVSGSESVEVAVERTPRAEADSDAENEKFLRVDINNHNENAGRLFTDNYIRTARYTVLNFIPKNLFEQFRRFSNLFFLLSAIISTIPSISPVGPTTTVSPLVFVLLVAAAKDAYEDYIRHKADKKANSAKYNILRTTDGNITFEELESADIVVGDIVYVEKGREFPADLVVLCTSEDQGICYVETSNLDGETNLKRRFSPAPTAELRERRDVEKLTGYVECEPPSPVLYRYQGTLHVKVGAQESVVALGSDNLLLRGAVLRNTKYAFGMVVYAGKETKLFKNLQLRASKHSRAQSLLNRVVMGIFVVDLLWITLCSVLANVYQVQKVAPAWYMGAISSENNWETGGRAVLTFFVLFTYLIPISLFVTIELVRLGQVIFMEWDPEMASDPLDVDKTHMLARNSSMNEELGQIEHVFSDKTGTLTRNVMETAWWSVGGVLYDQMKDRDLLAKVRRGEKPPPPSDVASGSGSGSSDDSSLEWSSEAAPSQMTDFLRVIALCNTVVPELHDDGHRTYEAQSPDEGALVEAARAAGVEFVKRSGTSVTVAVDGREEEYELLATLEFSSDRKRMSVIVKYPDGTIRLLCKGADMKVMERLREDDPLLKKTAVHLNKAAAIGLRTLMVGSRKLQPKQFAAWKKKFDAAQTSLGNREARIEAVEEEIEVDLALMGATAVEDKLQDQVPETIKFLLDAGVHVWVLTGDKQETAENIGLSSSLLTKGAYLSRVIAETQEEFARKLVSEGRELQRVIDEGATEEDFVTPSLIIDGHTLSFALEDMPEEFLALADKCRSVICCRVTPLQKAQVVGMMRKYRGTITLAIGDGANDVSMIQTAHVGVGVVGNEGTQAVRASDYAIHEFRLLAPLLAKHGRYSYIRLGTLIQYSFYKNIAYIFPQLLFGFWSAFSGQVVYDQYVLTTYNIFWVSVPPLFIGLFDFDLKSGILKKYPRLYQSLRHEDVFNLKSMGVWIANALVHGAILFFAAIFGVGYLGITDHLGRSNGIWEQAFLISTAGVFVSLFKAALTIKAWNPFMHLAVWGSMTVYMCFIMAYTQIPVLYLVYNITFQIMTTAAFWLGVPVIVAICLVPDLVVKYIIHVFYPLPWMVLREQAVVDKRNGVVNPGWAPTPRPHSSRSGTSSG